VRRATKGTKRGEMGRGTGDGLKWEEEREKGRGMQASNVILTGYRT